MIKKAKKILQNYRGYVLMTSIFVVIILLLMGTYFLNFTMSEYRIAKSQTVGVQDYYLAEAGIHEMIWRLKNNDAWKNSFETESTWSEEFTRADDLIPNGSYTVSINNTDLAQGEIISTGTMIVKGQTSQRVIKTSVYKAIGGNPTEDLAIYDNGVVDLKDSVVDVHLGGLFSNNNVLIKGSSVVYVEMMIQSVGNIIKSLSANVQADGGMVSQNIHPPAPDPISQPAVDFDSDDSNSYKNQADNEGHLYTESAFATYLEEHPSATLNGIYYVTGQVEIKRGMNITINGVLAADGSIYVGAKQQPAGALFARLHINHTNDEPSGLLSKHKIDFGEYTRGLNINGLLYSLEEIRMVSLPEPFVLVGGFYSRKLHTISIWQGLDITYDANTVNSTIGIPADSPTIYVDHWEEEY